MGVADIPDWSCTPDPPSAIAIVEFVALLAMDMLPAELPAASGAYFAVKLALCPAAMLAGTPLMVKPVPETDACEMLTPAFPVFDSVMVCDPAEPRLMLPKATLDGLALRVPCEVVPPVTVKTTGMDSGEFVTIDAVMNMCPLKVPAAKPLGFTPNWRMAFVWLDVALVVIQG